MSDNDIKRFTELATKKPATKITKEEALCSPQQAGILDKKGELTSPYQQLAKAVTTKK